MFRRFRLPLSAATARDLPLADFRGEGLFGMIGFAHRTTRLH